LRTPEDWRRARVTLAIAAITALAWGLVAGLNLYSEAAVWAGFIPARIGILPNDGSLAPLFLTPLTATLVHSGLTHLAFNMLLLLFCGRAVETIIGGPQLLILYAVGAYAAAAGHYLVGPASEMPAVGASGAVSAVFGAYAMLFGRNRVKKVANPTAAFWLNVLWLAAAYVVLQLIVGVTFQSLGTNIAFAAHIGGFFLGLALAKPLLLLRYRRA
jgi:membrane associated rhomboid family serine protease